MSRQDRDLQKNNIFFYAYLTFCDPVNDRTGQKACPGESQDKQKVPNFLNSALLSAIGLPSIVRTQKIRTDLFPLFKMRHSDDVLTEKENIQKKSFGERSEAWRICVRIQPDKVIFNNFIEFKFAGTFWLLFGAFKK